MRSTMTFERFVPADGNQLAVLAQQRLRSAARRIQNVVFAQSLGAELAAIHGVLRIAAHRDGFAVLHADQHAATNRAVSASGLDPLLGNARSLRCGRSAGLCRRHTLCAGIDAGYAIELCLIQKCSSIARLDEGERHVERHDRDEEEIARKEDAGNRGEEREQRYAR